MDPISVLCAASASAVEDMEQRMLDVGQLVGNDAIARIESVDAAADGGVVARDSLQR